MTETYGYDKTPTPPRDYDVNKVPSEIRKRTEWVKSKFTGEDVAEAYRQAGDIAGIYAGEAKRIAEQTQYRQDAVEYFNTQVIQEMTDKDVISAPEIIQARDGEQTLQDRLERTDAKINQTTIDVINGLVKVIAGESITTNGFYEFGNTYRYKVLSVVAGDNFVDTNKGFHINNNGEIKISSTVKLSPVITDSLSLGSLGCDNDNDDLCVQIAMNLARENDCNVDVDVDINIVGSIDIYRHISIDRRVIEFSGRGVITKYTSGFLLRNTRHRTGGSVKFTGIHFRSNAGAGTIIYDAGEMIQMYFNGCHFMHVDHLATAPTDEGINYIQTLYVNDCVFVGGDGWLINAPTAYDLSFLHNIVEHRESFVKINACHSVRIIDNLIEGLTGKILEVVNGRSLVFDYNYMEWNGTDLADSAITIDNPAFGYGFPEMMNFSFQNNLYIATDSQVSNSNYHYIQINNYLKSITIKNNFCDCNLLDVVNRHTIAIQPNKLIELFENNVINAKDVVSHIKSPRAVTIGSGNIITAFRRPMSLSSFKFFNDAINNEEIVSGSQIVTACQVGKASDKVGFIIEGVVLENNTQYALGISAAMVDYQNESDAVNVVLRDSTAKNILWEDTMNIKDGQLTTTYMTFYNLRPYLVTGGAKTVDVEISISPRSGSFVSTIYQALSVSNFVIQRGYVATDFIG